MAEMGAGPVVSARTLARQVQRRWPWLDAHEQLEQLLVTERRKQFGAAALCGMVSTVALPAGLPASLFLAAVIDVRMAMAAALLLGHALESPAVREAIEKAVEDRTRSLMGEAVGPFDSAAAAVQWRTAIEQFAPKAFGRSRQWLLSRASLKWQRRLLPAMAALPVASNLLIAAVEARAMDELLRRVESYLGNVSPANRALPRMHSEPEEDDHIASLRDHIAAMRDADVRRT